MSVTKKTQAIKRKEQLALKHARKVPRTKTKGPYTFKSAKIEAEIRGFKVAKDAKIHWNAQSSTTPSMRKLLMTNKSEPYLNNIMSGHNRPTPPTAKEIAATRRKQSETLRARGLRQTHWVEATAIKAVKRIIDPFDEFDFEVLPDGLNPDVAVRFKGADLYAGVQFKAREYGDWCNSYKISQADGDIGGQYETLIIITSAMKDLHTSGFKQSMIDFDFVPEVEVGELFLFGNATEFPNKTLSPYPRRESEDQYGHHRFVFGFDEEERLETMRNDFKRLIWEKSKWTRSQLWFSTGSGSPNPNLSTGHSAEVLNCKSLAEVVGFDNLRAPKVQNETVDVIWTVNNTQELRISLKTALVNHDEEDQGFKFELQKHPNAQHCDFVFAFYKNESGVRTHVSVINARRVYLEDVTTFNWSPTNNADVLFQRIALDDAEHAKEMLESMIDGIRGSCKL
ncbi:hypothetical protein JKP88DRAFT_241036 [Tribonema minus]|uniref:Uncharacterized protein n=1 Tax=Tribonema minus TaxID=303371 RepID=A0A836CI59_9STRA|nr:hypothetical protein JKP88DRAFT_241036 [Tribonema minus]